MAQELTIMINGKPVKVSEIDWVNPSEPGVTNLRKMTSEGIKAARLKT